MLGSPPAAGGDPLPLSPAGRGEEEGQATNEVAKSQESEPWVTNTKNKNSWWTSSSRSGSSPWPGRIGPPDAVVANGPILPALLFADVVAIPARAAQDGDIPNRSFQAGHSAALFGLVP